MCCKSGEAALQFKYSHTEKQCVPALFCRCTGVCIYWNNCCTCLFFFRFFFQCVSPPPPLLDKIYYTDILSFRLLSCFFFFLSFLFRQACLVRFWARDVLLLSLWLCAVRLDGDSSSRLQWRVLVRLTCLDWLDVIGRVQSLSAGVQTTSTPALLVLVFSLGQFVACEETPAVSHHLVVCQKPREGERGYLRLFTDKL